MTGGTLDHTITARRGLVTVHRGRKAVYAGTPAHARWLCAQLLAAADQVDQVHPFVDDPGRPGRCELCWHLPDHNLHDPDWRQ